MIYKHTISFIVLGVLYGMCMLNAQNSATAKPQKSVEIDFQVFAYKPIKGIHYAKEFTDDGSIEKAEELGFRNSGRSVGYTYEGPETIRFFKKIPAPTPKDPNAWRPEVLAEKSLSKYNGDEFLFVFFPNPKKKDNYLILALEETKQAHPPGAIKVVNVTRKNYQCVYKTSGTGDISDRKELRPGDVKLFRAKDAGSLVCFRKYNGNWHQVYGKGFELSGNERKLVFLFPSLLEGSINVQATVLTDYKTIESQTEEEKQNEVKNNE